jgi:hypothetical protein
MGAIVLRRSAKQVFRIDSIVVEPEHPCVARAPHLIVLGLHADRRSRLKAALGVSCLSGKHGLDLVQFQLRRRCWRGRRAALSIEHRIGSALLTWISIGRGTMITGGGAVVAAGFERCPAPAGRQGQKKCREVSDPTFIKK